MVLLITNNNDVHADAVEAWLRKWSVPYFRFHPDEIATRYTFIFKHKQIETSFIIEDNQTGKSFAPNKVGSVWYRRAKAPVVHSNTAIDSQKFFFEELSASISSIYASLSSATWINKISDIAYANDKINQLSVASNLGFNIPLTIVTNKVEEAFAFYQSQPNGCIVKSFRPTLVGENTRVFTHKFADNLKIDDFSSVLAAPTKLQEFIDKKSDVRITLVGDKIFACKIYSQNYDKTKVDFRCADMFDLPHEIFELPKDFEERLLNYANHFNLLSCEFDFAENQNGDLIFLECNPNGQWLWVEIVARINISEIMAKLLTDLATQNAQPPTSVWQ